MATECKLYRNTPLVIPPLEWTLVTYDRAIRNDRKMAVNLETIRPPEDGDFIWLRNLRWNDIEIPEGDDRQRQFMAHFIRDPHGVRDDTGAEDGLDTPGRDWDTTTWSFYGNAGQPVGVEVWHDHHEPVELGHAQFIGITWDY